MRRRAVRLALALALVVALASACRLGRGASEDAAAPTVEAVPTFTPTPEPAPATAAASADQLAYQQSEFVHLVAEDADVFNPVLTNSSTSVAVLGLIYPRLVGRDAQTGVITPTQMASGWDISPDGRAYTFRLRTDVLWSDGQPVTAADFRYTYEALAGAQDQSPARDRLDAIAAIETPDPHTIIVRLEDADCSVLQRLRLPWLPSHRYAADYADLASNPLNSYPVVSAGPFRFVEWTPGERIVLEHNADYWQGAPRIGTYALRVEPDERERLRIMAAGEAHLLQLTAEELVTATDVLAGPVRLDTYPAQAVEFLALNLADPKNPQTGLDEAGNTVAQAPHPVLADPAVRQAIALGIDIARLQAESVLGQGYVPATAVLSSVPWAHAAELQPRGHQPAAAAAALENAGWRDGDGDGIREKSGTRLSLTLLTNEENAARMRAADLIVEQLGALGFEIVRESAPFGQATATILGQRYDMALLGWENLPADPGLMPLWRSADDVPGAGVNFTSFQDAEVDAWLDQAQAVTDCGLEQRGELYRRVQKRVYDEVPVVLLRADTEAWAVSLQWAGVEPGAWGPGEDVQTWRPAQ